MRWFAPVLRQSYDRRELTQRRARALRDFAVFPLGSVIGVGIDERNFAVHGCQRTHDARTGRHALIVGLRTIGPAERDGWLFLFAPRFGGTKRPALSSSLATSPVTMLRHGSSTSTLSNVTISPVISWCLRPSMVVRVSSWADTSIAKRSPVIRYAFRRRNRRAKRAVYSSFECGFKAMLKAIALT